MDLCVCGIGVLRLSACVLYGSFDFGFGVGYVDCGVGGLFSVNLCLRLLFGLCFGCLVLGLLHCEFIWLIVLFWIGCFVVVW